MRSKHRQLLTATVARNTRPNIPVRMVKTWNGWLRVIARQNEAMVQRPQHTRGCPPYYYNMYVYSMRVCVHTCTAFVCMCTACMCMCTACMCMWQHVCVAACVCGSMCMWQHMCVCVQHAYSMPVCVQHVSYVCMYMGVHVDLCISVPACNCQCRCLLVVSMNHSQSLLALFTRSPSKMSLLPLPSSSTMSFNTGMANDCMGRWGGGGGGGGGVAVGGCGSMNVRTAVGEVVGKSFEKWVC